MFTLRNFLFWGQGRKCPAYYQLFLSDFLSSNFKNLNNKLEVCKTNTNRKKWKFKTLCFDENGIGKFFISEGTRPLPKCPPCSGVPNTPRPSLDELSLRKNPFTKRRGPSFTSTKTTSLTEPIAKKPAGLCCLTLTRKKPTNEGPFLILNRRGFHSSGSTLKTGNTSSTRSHREKSSSSRGWLSLEGYQIYPWSISGLETCVVVKSERDKKLAVTFDLGYSTRPSVRCQHVFISHGHLDHVSALFQHATKRNLYSLPPAVYYVPPNLVEPLRKIGQLLHTLSGTPDALLHLDIRPIRPGDSVLVTPDYEIRPFETIHRVPSQGYLLYHRYKRLKPLYQHLRPKEIAQLENEKPEEKIYEISWIPELAFTGDTTFELFLNNPPADLFKVRVLILEATYLESVTPGIVHKARERGHTHISEIIDHAHLFADIERLILIHMSDKYSSSFARDAISFQMPPALLRKVVIATLAKDRS